VTGLAEEADALFGQVRGVMSAIPADRLDALAQAIARARICALYGQGRAGLVMEAFTMRLHHLGVEAHAVGAMNASPVGPGDLFLVNAAMGDLPTALALIGSARRAGAGVALFTAAVDSAAAADADHVVPIPAPMGRGVDPTGPLVMGGAYEWALWGATELLVHRLMRLLGVTQDAMWARHANLL
jgi:6-phospho-3-hexuloisomerase